MTNNEKIATLTADAIRTSGENVAKEIMDMVDEAEDAARQLRAEAETLVSNIRKNTNEFADRITDFVAQCHTTAGEFKTRGEKVAVVARQQLRELPVLISENDLKASA